MNDPAFYPHPVSRIERRDTHISAVFLTGDVVYKLKKPLNLGFLDFSHLEDRHVACMRELFLNRRLSQNVYLEVIPISIDRNGAVTFENRGAVVEYAVKMRQLPDRVNLKSLLAAGGVGDDHMVMIGRRLARFYEESERSVAIDAYGSTDAVAFNMEENFTQLAPWAGTLLETSRWEFLCEANRSFVSHHAGLFERRIEEGRIRDGHGDLRTDHVYFDDGTIDGGIQMIDCIEFNDRFRYGDAAVDIGFLVMDMLFLGHAALARTLLAAYAAAAQDPGVFALIDFYVVYRAVVRLKIACLQLSSTEEDKRERLAADIDRYMDLAYRHTLMIGRPTLWVCCGMPASGKSSLAGRLGDVLGLRVFSSDQVRKAETDPAAGVSAYGKGAYSAGRRSRVYGRLLALAQDELRAGRSVILDATHGRRCWRKDVCRLAADMDAGLIFAECVAAPETLRRRLARREHMPGTSDARLGHFDRLSAEFEALADIHGDMKVRVDTEGPPDTALITLLKDGCARRAVQIDQLLS